MTTTALAPRTTRRAKVPDSARRRLPARIGCRPHTKANSTMPAPLRRHLSPKAIAICFDEGSLLQWHGSADVGLRQERLQVDIFRRAEAQPTVAQLIQMAETESKVTIPVRARLRHICGRGEEGPRAKEPLKRGGLAQPARRARPHDRAGPATGGRSLHPGASSQRPYQRRLRPHCR